MTRRRRLIEIAFPLEEVSAHSRREKNVCHGHISTLHIAYVSMARPRAR